MRRTEISLNSTEEFIAVTVFFRNFFVLDGISSHLYHYEGSKSRRNVFIFVEIKPHICIKHLVVNFK